VLDREEKYPASAYPRNSSDTLGAVGRLFRMPQGGRSDLHGDALSAGKIAASREIGGVSVVEKLGRRMPFVESERGLSAIGSIVGGIRTPS
jgi:hypothetical protein